MADPFAHELCHLLGAKDKYNRAYVDKSEIMNLGSFSKIESYNEHYAGALIKEVHIGEETAKEIGWVKD